MSAVLLLSLALAADRSTDPRITSEELHDHVAELASDAYGGRMPGTDGGAKTEAYVAAAFEAAGVEPAFPDYRQPVALQLVRPESATATLHAGGERIGLVLGDDLSVSGGTRTKLGPTEVVFAGHGVVTDGRDDYGGLDVTDKVVLLLPGAPGLEPGPVPAVEGTPSWKKEEARRRGAVAVLWVHQDSMGYPWGAVAGQAWSEKASLADDPPILSALVRGEPGADALAAAGESLDALVDEAGAPGFAARELDLSLSLRRKLAIRTVVSHNVVGRVVGTERPDEAVVYTAHWDHVGIGAPVDGDRIYNGAVDNATGTAALIEIAEAFAADPPARTVIFVATTAEEQGLLGAEHYANDPVLPLDDTVAVLNMDALFPFGATTSVTVTAPGSTDLEDWFGPAAAAQGRTLLPDPQPEAQAWFRSDHYPLAAKGVPAMFAVGGPGAEPTPEQIADYTDFLGRRYHKPQDELDATWDFAGILQDARLYHAAGQAIANDPRRPTWQ